MPPKQKKRKQNEAEPNIKTPEKEKDLPSSSRRGQTKSNNNIFILNIETDKVLSILREFVTQAKTCKRMVIAPIFIDEIEKELSSVKNVSQTFVKPPGKPEPKNSASFSRVTFKQIFEATKLKIASCIEENDSMQAKCDTMKRIDILKYWQELREPLNNTKTSEKEKAQSKTQKNISNKKSKSKEKIIKSKNEKKVGNEKLANNDKNKQDDEKYSHKSFPQIVLNANIQSKFHSDSQISQGLQKVIADHPEDGPLLYLIIIGTLKEDFCLDLIRENYPVIAFFSICSNNASSNKPIITVSESLAKDDLTKETYLMKTDFPFLSRCEAAENKERIYDELCWLMYDAVTLKRQHINYLAHVTEIDVEEHAAFGCPHIQTDIFEHVSNINAIPLYIDDLLKTVTKILNSDLEQKLNCSSASADCFPTQPLPLFQFHGKEIAEYRNKILTNVLATENRDISFYPKCIEVVTKFNLLKSLWNKMDISKCERGPSWSPSNAPARRPGSKSSVMTGSEISYVEILSRDAMAQRFNELLAFYDFYYVNQSDEKDKLDICFCNSPDQYHEETETFFIPTKVCFRDYCKYVADEIEEWTEKQETLYEDRKMRKTLLSKHPKIIFFDELTIVDFVLTSSLKFRATTNSNNAFYGKETANNTMTESKEIPNEMLIDDMTATKAKLRLFTAYNIGDTRFQITSSKANFKIVGGSVRLLEDKYVSGKALLRIDMDYYGDHIILNHEYPSNKSQISMKVYCHNDMLINLTSLHRKSLQDSPEASRITNVLGSQIQINCIWPNGLEIRSVYNPETGELLGIEQTPIKSATPEIKRMYFTNGTVAIYYEDGFVDIFTSSGVIYETVKLDEHNFEIITTYSEGGDSNLVKKNQLKYSHEMLALDRLNCDIFKEKYKFTTPDGHVFEVFGGVMVRESRKLHLVEWCDYACGERYSMLEGGVKTRLMSGKYDVYFQNGTLITTSTADVEIFENTAQDENILLGTVSPRELVADASADGVAGIILDEILDYVSEERYITCERTFLIQHENYATIYFENEQVIISCPDEVTIVLKNEKIDINIKRRLNIDFNSDECFIRGRKNQDQISDVEAKLCFNTASSPFIHLRSRSDAELNVSQNGSRKYIKSGPCPPKFSCQKERLLVVNRNLDGFELLNSSNVEAIIERAKDANYFSICSFEKAVVFAPIQSLVDRYKLSILDINNFLMKFAQKGQMCVPITSPAVGAALNLIPRTMSLRLFLLSTKYFGRLHPSTAEVLSPTSSSLADIDYENGSSINTFKLLEHEVQIAFKTFLKNLSQKEDLVELEIPSTVMTSKKYNELLKKIKAKRWRAIFYQQMVRHSYCPKFKDFQNANYSIANMNVEGYKEILNQLDGLSPNASYATNFTSLHQILEDREHIKRLHTIFLS